jgi:hypothetical protein
MSIEREVLDRFDRYAKQQGLEGAEDLVDRMTRMGLIADELVDQGVHPTTAVIMASDRLSAEDMERRFRAGEITAELAVNLTGSFARLEQARKFVHEGWLEIDWLLANLPDLWRGSDPDDTSDEYLRLWKRARVAKGRLIVDGKLPRFGPIVTVYRGQMPGDPLGIAWTTDRTIAVRFAKGAGGRAPMDGAVVTGTVARRNVIAFLSERGESEVIVDPGDVKVEKIVEVRR